VLKPAQPTIVIQGFLEAGVSVLLFGCVPVVIKYLSANAFTIGIFRLGVASICMLAMLRAKKELFRLKRKELLILTSIGLLFGAHWMTHFISIKVSSASIASIGLSTYGIHLILLTRFVEKNRVTLSDGIAVFLAAAGSILIIPQFSLSNHTTLGVCLGIISGLFCAILPVLHQRYAHIPSSMRAFAQFLFGFVFFLFFFPLSEWSLPPRDWFWLVFLAVIGTFVAHTLWVRVTTTLSTKATSVIFYLFVPIAMLLSFLLLDEPMSGEKVVGAAAVIAGNLFGLSRQWRNDDVLARRIHDKTA